MDVTGVLKVKGETKQVSDKFKSREFVLTDNSSQYPQHISFVATQEKCGILDKFNTGENIKVHFNLRGREWKSPSGEVKYFNSLEVWRIEGMATPIQTDSDGSRSVSQFQQADNDNLPF